MNMHATDIKSSEKTIWQGKHDNSSLGIPFMEKVDIVTPTVL
jgi:hypothetical protein